VITRRSGTTFGRPDTDTPVRSTCEVVARRREGAYWRISFAAKEIAERAHPGQFVQIAVDTGGTLLRRPFSIAQVSRQGIAAGTVDVVFDAHGAGTDWLTHLDLHDVIDVVGPLGTPFPMPQRQVNCLLVGGGYGTAPLYFLGERLVRKGLRVDMVVGAASQERIAGAIDAKRTSASVTFTTEDGSYGVQGRVTDVLAEVAATTKAGVIYACGPNPMLAAVSAQAQRLGLPVQVAVEEKMGCGIGVCFTCVLPIRTKKGELRMRRACVEGPVFNGVRVAWDLTRFAGGPPETGWRQPGDEAGAAADADGVAAGAGDGAEVADGEVADGDAERPGDVAPAGSRGGKGPGKAGEAGSRGGPGKAGEAGSRGSPGKAGEAGSRGGPGKAGEAGSRGGPGKAGEAGSRGGPGKAGEAGSRGGPGKAGEAGSRGGPGTRGLGGSGEAPGAGGVRGRDPGDGARARAGGGRGSDERPGTGGVRGSGDGPWAGSAAEADAGPEADAAEAGSADGNGHGPGGGR
jgi:dihydroorotate dehydrogenase electron transfer subunit